MRFRKRPVAPVEVEAIEVTDENIAALRSMGGVSVACVGLDLLLHHNTIHSVYVHTREGGAYAMPGEWIVANPDGSRSIMTASELAQTYESVQS